ncbi:MAG: hypothetical protein Q8P35_02095 [Candidatus Yanofskybacteria bacterium]|nr:hypothetical protein [Candidatus Yanofskybacteria bacterium]
MNTKYLGVMALVAVALIVPSAADAGLMDWIKEGRTSTLPAQNMSFGQIYETLNFTNKSQEEAMPVFQNNSVKEVSAPMVANVRQAPITPKAKQTFVVSLSGYSSTPDQTDDSPFITAKGTYVRDGIVAANFLPFGTAIKIPSLYGDKIFVVEDRMNKRYWLNVDIWFPERETAKQLGRRTVAIEVL